MRSTASLLCAVAAAATAFAAGPGNAPPGGMPPVMPAGSRTVTVDVPQVGSVTGFVNTLQDQNTWEFRGIPYAKPPVGTLRWQSPEAADTWSGAWNATTDAPGCPQSCDLPHGTCPQVMDEDCLYLNIYAPAGAKAGDDLPVAFWIHGGNFKQGYSGGFLYDGTVMASTHKVVVVTINYRLGALGFMYTGQDTTIQGMYGIEDQRMAMKWVQDNIGAFGGDKARVTLYGQSAGAMSIATHMSLAASEPYYAQSILQSEPFSLPFRHAGEMVSLASAFGQKSGCKDTTEPGFDECVRGLNTSEVIRAQVQAEVDIAASLGHILEVFQPWTPLINPEDPERALQMMPLDYFNQGLAHDKPLLLGTVENEAIPFIYQAFTKPTGVTEYTAVLDVIFGIKAAAKVMDRYPLPADQKADTRRHMSLLGTRELFVCPVRNATKAFSQTRTSPVWVYHFDEIWSFGQKGWGANYSCCWDEVCHGAELPFVYQPDPAQFGIDPPMEDEYDLMHRMMAHWSNFFHSSDPNSPANETLSYWPAFNGTAEAWKRFQLGEDLVQYRNYTDECQWWTDNVGYHIY